MLYFYVVITNYEKEKLKKKSPFYKCIRKKYRWMNLMEEVKDLYTGNYKTLRKETRVNGKILHSHGLEKNNVFKIFILPKASTDSMQSLSNFQWYSLYK